MNPATRRFLVLVTPAADEAHHVTREQALAGLDWLHRKLAAGVLTAAEAYPETGGYMIVAALSADAVPVLLADYPLRHTITTTVHELVPLAVGFDALLAAIDAHQETPA